MLISFLYILEFENFKHSNTGSVIPRLTCWAYTPLFSDFLRMAPRCRNMEFNSFCVYVSIALYGPGPPRFFEVSWSHTFETHHSR
jgi:hypothetical protein